MKKNKMFKVAKLSWFSKHKNFQKESEVIKYPITGNEDSNEKMLEYSNNDFDLIQIRYDMFYTKLASLMHKNPSDPEVQMIVDDKRKLISNYFYNCTPEVYRGLGESYVSNSKFMANIDRYKVGLASFERAAINYYCDHLG